MGRHSLQRFMSAWFRLLGIMETIAQTGPGAMSMAQKLYHKLWSTMEPITKHVEGQNNGQKTAATHDGLQVPCWAVGVQGLPAYFDFSNQKRPHYRLDHCTPTEKHFVLCSEPAAFA